MNPLLELDDRLRAVFSTQEGRQLRESLERVDKAFSRGVLADTIMWASLVTRFEERLAKEAEEDQGHG